MKKRILSAFLLMSGELGYANQLSDDLNLFSTFSSFYAPTFFVPSITFSGDNSCNGAACPASPASPYASGGEISIGVNNVGSLTIQDGAVVSANNGINIGLNVGSNGTVTVTGAGSTWINSSVSSGLTVGNSGNGSLTISDGGAVNNSATGSIGTSSASDSIVLVTGAGSTWTNSRNLFIGNLSNGRLTIENGGSVSNASGFIAASGGNGTVTVTDIGSTWTNSTALQVGTTSTAVLNIDNGGFVNVSTITTIASQAGSQGTLNLNSTAGVQGILATTQLVGGNGTRAANFNGGILRAKANQTNFITGFSAGELQLLANGLTIDSNGFNLVTSAVLSGTGGITKQGAGILTLSGNNLYSGDTIISAGTLELGGGTTSGSVAGNIVNNATLQFSHTNDLSYSGAISGTGNVIQAGTGTVILLGTNSYSGLTTISSGILQIGDGGTSGNISGDIANDAGLVFNRADNLTYAAAISGSGSMIQSGAGKLILTGNNGAFTGITSVQNGTLEVNGTLGGNLLVTSLGILGGTGTLNELTVNGIIAPGHSIGTLTIAGNYTQAPGSVYEVEINPQGQSDLINVNQTAAINGGAVEVVKEAGIYIPGTRYTILTAGGGVSGTYTNLSQANLPFLNLSLNYDNNHVFLDIARSLIPGSLLPFPNPILTSPTIVPFASVAITSNQINTANAVESLNPLDPVFLSVLNAPDEQSARYAFDNLSGEIYVSTLGVFLEESRYVRDAVLNRLQQAFSFPPVLRDEKFGHQQQVSMDSGLSLWTDGFGSWGHLRGNFNAAQLNRSTGGSFLGGDLRFAEALRIGILGGYSNSNFAVRARNSYGNSDNYHLGAYAGTEIDHWGLRIGGVHTWHDINQARNVIFPHFANHLASNYNAHTTQAFAEAGYHLKAKYLTLEPFAGLAYVSLNNNFWYESSSPAALQGKGNEDVTYSTFGLREKAQLYQTERFLLSEKVMLAWRHAYGQVNPHSTLNFANGSIPFLIGGTAIAKDSLLINAGINLNPVLSARNLFFSLDYSGQIATNVSDHGIFGSIRWCIS